MNTTTITFPDTHRDLLQTDIAMLATNGQDGFPQVTALWFFFDEEDQTLKLSLNTARQKVRNLRDNPECTLFILDRANPLRTLEVRAIAEIHSDRDYTFAGRFGRKYGGIDLRTIDRPGEERVMVVLRPLKIVPTDMTRG